jgi:hypothetical protein
MKLVVVHDAEGGIISVARAEPTSDDGPKGSVGAWPDRGYRVAELDVSDEFAELAPSEIVERYRVDTRARKLTAASGGAS